MTSKGESDQMHEDGSWDLLPWYVNGTANEDERAQIERDLMVSPALRDELRFQKRLHQGISKRDYFDAVEDAHWERLNGLLDDADGQKPAVVETDTNNVVAFHSKAASAQTVSIANTVRSNGWRMGGLIAASLVFVAFLTVAPQEKVADFQTLTDETIVERPLSEASLLRIKASDSVTSSDMMRYFKEAGLSVLEGPSSTGVYTLELKDGEIDIDKLVRQMWQSDEIDFVTRLQDGVR